MNSAFNCDWKTLQVGNAETLPSYGRPSSAAGAPVQGPCMLMSPGADWDTLFLLWGKERGL